MVRMMVPWPRVPNLATHFFDMNINEIGHAERIEGISPNVLGQAETRHGPVHVVEEKFQNGKFPGRQLHGLASLGHFATDGIEL